MAPLPVIPGVYRTAINFVAPVFGGVATNVIHVFTPTIDLPTLGGIVAGALDSEMFDATTSDITVPSIEVTPLDGVSASQSFPVTAVGGTQASSGIPNTAAVVTFQTLRRGRSFRGRAYTPWVAEGIVDNGTVETGVVNTMLNAWVQFQVDLLAALVIQVVASYLLGSQELISTYAMDTRSDTQRRRLNVIGA